MQCIAILWNSMNDFFDEAITDITKYAVVEDVIFVDFKHYRNFVKDIYAHDEGIGKRGFDDYKANIMVDKYNSNQICILYLTLPQSEKKYVERKKTYVYKSIEEIKQYIRSKYKVCVSNYNFDNVFHMTDDEKEYDYVNTIIRNYLQNDLKKERFQKRIK